jgi:hypothetical protein
LIHQLVVEIDPLKSKKNAVSIMCASVFPMAVRWGLDFTLIYEGYKPILADKHMGLWADPFEKRGLKCSRSFYLLSGFDLIEIEST